MTITCPKCGYKEEAEDVEIGDIVHCPCGHDYKAGYVSVQPKDFTKVYADVRCPFCKAINALPSEAVHKNVRCGSCGDKFHVTGEAPTLTKAAPVLIKKARPVVKPPVVKPPVVKQMPAEAKPTDNSTGVGTLLFVIVVFIALIFSPLLFNLPIVWVDDDICVAMYISDLSKRDYAGARKWAKRIKSNSSRKEALDVIDKTEKGSRSMGYYY